MRALDRKAIRDLWLMKGQALAISLVVACGVATFVMSLSSLRTLENAKDSYYQRYRFADLFAHLKRAPNALAVRIAEIPGVERVETRVVVNVTLDVPGMIEPAVGRLISIPERSRPSLNDVHLRRGRYIEAGREGEILASEPFADAHGLEPGDSIQAVINGRKRRLRIVGIALSPEYIYQIREGDIVPDDRRYGVFWMGQSDLSSAFDMLGAFNDAAIALRAGASEPDALLQLDRLIEPYGGLGSYGRSDQVSNKFISNEIDQLRGMAFVAPLIFLSVAGFILNVVFTRLIGTQREQIAALKAFGYSKWEVGAHYLKQAALIVIFGAVIGTAGGYKLGQGVSEIYSKFFRFPIYDYHFEPRIAVFAIGISLAAAMAGAFKAVIDAVRLPPAVALRPEPPPTYRPTAVERWGLGKWLSAPAKMILRQLERRFARTLASMSGVALAVAILILGYFSVDAIEFVMETQFRFAERQDVSIAFVEPVSSSALADLRSLPGVRRCEPFRALAVRLRSEHRSRRLAILGTRPDPELRRLFNLHRRPLDVPSDGLLISAKLGELLEVRLGDPLTIEILEGSRLTRTATVAGFIEDMSGFAAYMDLHALNRLAREGDLISGASLAVDPGRMDQLHETLKATPKVASVTIKTAAMESFRKTIAENLLTIRLFNIAFACVIACGVIYNTARVSLSERSRELATLRIMGFTRGEISFILLGELAAITLAAIPPGMAIGYGLGYVLVNAQDTELFRIPVIISPSTYAFAAAVTICASLASGLAVRRALDRLDLVSVLKSKE